MDIITGNIGWIEVICGPMFSGKSEELIRRLRRAVIARKRVEVFKPLIDDRYSVDEIVSHGDLRMQSQGVSGASEILDRKELSAPGKPLAKERWAGAVDSVGSTTLANVLAGTRYGGAVAACGLAGGMDLPTTVAPFILRAVSLLGIDSVMCPREVRREAWNRLASDLDRGKLQTMTNEIQLPGVLVAAPAILDGRIRGRIVVKIG